MCNCLSTLIPKLAEKGQRLEVHVGMQSIRTDEGVTTEFFEALAIPLIRIETGKRETRKDHPKVIFAKHCPFCGAQVKP